MTDMTMTAVVSLVSAAIGATASLGATWLTSATQRRAQSGSVGTSDAQTLFAASNQLIQLLLTTTQQLTEQLRQLTGQLDTMTTRVERLVQQQDELLRMQRDQMETLHRIENGGRQL